MNTLSEYPRFRQDVEIIAQASPGRTNRHVLRDPGSGQVIEMTDKEVFLCRQLDGATPLVAVQTRFMDRYGLLLRLEHLQAFVGQLADNGFLAGVEAAPPDNLWPLMKPLPVAGDRAIERLARWFGWCFSRPAYAAFGLLLLVQLVILSFNWNEIWYQIENLFYSITMAGENNAPSLQLAFRVLVVLIAMPFLSEVVKGVACRHYGYHVPEIRYMWYMRFIPRCGSDIAAVARIEEKKHRLHVAASGLLFQLGVMAVATLVMEMLTYSNPVRDFAFSLALGAAIGFLVNACPLGKADGSLLLSIGLEAPDFRGRAVRVFRAGLFRAPAPEPLSGRDRRLFFWYGMLADAYTVVINVLLFWLVGYLLTEWLQGLGGVLFVALVALRFEDDIRKLIMRSPVPDSVSDLFSKDSPSRGWLVWGIVAFVLIVLFVIPYPCEIAGEFRVQADAKREVRAEVQAQIASVPVKEGQWIKAGDVIALLDQRGIQHELDQAQSSLAKAQEDLKLLEAGAKAEMIAKAEQVVTVAETIYMHSASTYQRAEELHAKNHISDQDFENALKQRDIDRENLELARRDLTLVKSGARAEEIAGQKDVVAGLQSTADHLAGDLERTSIVSPIEGQVTTVYLQGKVGQLVNPGDVVAIVEDSRKITVRIAMPEQYASEVKLNARVRAKPWAYSTRILKGTVTAINATVTEQSEDVLKQDAVEQEKGSMRSLNMPGDNVVLVLAELDNSDGLLRSEMTGFAKIDAPNKPLGWALLGPVLRFFRVRVWSWLP